MFIPLLTIAFGVASLWVALRFRRSTVRTRNWPATEGRILERRVGERMSSGRAYLPYVRYRYMVDGVEYVGERVNAVGQAGGSAKAMQALVDSLPEPIPVRYNPADPSESYLLPSPSWPFPLLLLFGTLVLLIGAMQLVIALVDASRE